MEAAAAELERLQIEILHRISVLESSILPQSSSAAPSPSLPVNENETVARLSSILRSGGVNDFCFNRVALDYYDWPLESRRNVLGASSIDHLCKSIVLVLQLNSVDFLRIFFLLCFRGHRTILQSSPYLNQYVICETNTLTQESVQSLLKMLVSCYNSLCLCLFPH